MFNNLFSSSRRVFNKSTIRNTLFRDLKRKFCQSNLNKVSKIEIINDPKDSQSIVVKIPKNEQNVYNFGLTNDFAIYENFECVKENTGNHIPLNKTNILLFGGLTVYAFYSSSFQLALLIQFYIFNKFLLKQNRKLAEIVYISLLPDFESIYIRTHSMSFKYEIDSLKYENTIKLGKETFAVLKDKNSKMTFYMNSVGRIINVELLNKIISGDYTKVSFEYI